jgi:flavin-dependent dehydrogenase
MATSVTDTDVAVIGAGPAGTATALFLRQAGREVTVVTPEKRRGLGAGESLPPVGHALLGELGVPTGGHLECHGTISAWGSPELTYRDYLADGLGTGWHVDRARFDQSMLDAAVDRGVVLLRTRFLHARRAGGRWLCTHSGGLLTTSFVVDATGRRAAFGVGQGARRRVVDHLVGIAAVFPRADYLGHSLVEAVEHGWWYAGALPDMRLQVALLSDSDIVRHHEWAEPATLAAALRNTHHVARMIGPVAQKPVTVRAANSQVLTPCVGEGWIAVGDAAMATDPLSSAGIAEAMRTGMEAGRAIVSGDLADVAARQAHDQRNRQRFTAYLRQRQHFYCLEQRWDAPFWLRRRLTA